MINEQADEIFHSTLYGVNDEPGLVYGVVIDALYKWKDNMASCLMLTDILVNQEERLSPNRLTGILCALREFQEFNPLPDYLVDRIFKLVESRIIAYQPEDNEWFNLALRLLNKEYTQKRLVGLIDLAVSPYGIPKEYSKPYLALLGKYIATGRNKADIHVTFVEEVINKVMCKHDESRNTESIIFLKTISEMLQATVGLINVATPLSSMTLLLAERERTLEIVDTLHSALNRRADLGVKVLLWECTILFLLMLAGLLTNFDWNVLEKWSYFIAIVLLFIPL
ncbi:MAG: hypothetical protein HZB33_07635 [Nitrospirae bacterium]|nr:hypothetical protein [Nitrospirota bacterium]